MTTHPVLVLHDGPSRARAARWCQEAPAGSRVEWKPPRRSNDQNGLLHVLITHVANQVPWGGRRRSVEAWKDIFTAALVTTEHDLEVVPGINGGFVLLGLHTSGLSKEQASNLIEMIYEFGARHGVNFGDEARSEAAA